MAKSSSAPSRLKGAKVLFGIAIALAVAVAVFVLMLLSEVASTTRYYVLNQDVPARTLITADMLAEVVTSQNSAPMNAYDIADVTSREVYAAYALKRGDVISESNSGELTPIRQGIPDEYVVTSFSVDADRAVAGRVVRGDYVDVIAISNNPTTGDERAQYILRNVLILDVNVDLASVQDEAVATSEESTASDSASARRGIPSLYTVGLTPYDAAVLAVSSSDTLSIVLSPIQAEGEAIIPEDISVNKADIFSGMYVAGNAGLGTDSSFGTDPDNQGPEGEATSPAPHVTPEPGMSPNPDASPGMDDGTSDNSMEDDSMDENSENELPPLPDLPPLP